MEQTDGTIYMLEDAWTYEVAFKVWPSQASYDLVAALNNHVIEWGDDFICNDVDDEGNPITMTIPFEEYKSQIKQGTPYSLKTNTSAGVKYKQVTAVLDDDGNVVSYEYGEEKNVPIQTDYDMGLATILMPVKKEFAHAINSQDPYAKIRFYLMVDGMYYMSDGSLSDTLVEPTSVTTADNGDLVVEPELHTVFMDLDDSNNWTDQIYIAPGLITDTRATETDGVMRVLEHGHTYTLSEIILEGSEYEYEFTPQTVRPMVISSQLTYLVMQDDYNQPAAGATTYVIDGKTYFAAASDKQALIGTNRKTAELDITKLIKDDADLLTDAEEATETFTYRVTLSIPDGSDPAGIVGYEYVPRTTSNAYTLYGYQGSEASRGFDSDVERFSGKTFRAWNTLVYRDLVEWQNVGGKIVSVTDDDGNIIWKVPAATVAGHGDTLYHTVTYDMTLKQDEVIRFTNLPSGTLYTIQEIYVDMYPADNAGGTTSGRAPISDPSNIAEAGYTVSVQSTGVNEGTASNTATATGGDTIRGEIKSLDTRYYNQFTNSTTKVLESVRAELKVKKEVEGYEWLSEYYRFTLAAGTCTFTDDEGGTGTSPTPGGTENSVVSIYDSTDEHMLTFGNVLYTRPGVYTYTITEAWAESYVLKPGPATITVTVEPTQVGEGAAQVTKLVVTSITGTGAHTSTEFTAATNTAIATAVTTMTNTIVPTTVSADKAWIMADGSSTPPEGATVTFTLYSQVGDGEAEATEYTATLDGTADETAPEAGGYESEAWTATFVGVPRYVVETVTNEDGSKTRVATPITYTIKETAGYTGFEIDGEDTVADGGTITNKQVAANVALKKIGDAQLTNLLSGATFELYSTYDAENPENNVKAKNAVTGEDIGTITVTDGIGYAGYLSPGTYALVETNAPDGHKLLAQPVQVVVTATEDGITVAYTQADYNAGAQTEAQTEEITVDEETVTAYVVVVNNTSGLELPMTGGIGTTAFYVIGAMLILGAAAMLIMRRRMVRVRVK